MNLLQGWETGSMYYNHAMPSMSEFPRFNQSQQPVRRTTRPSTCTTKRSVSVRAAVPFLWYRLSYVESKKNSHTGGDKEGYVAVHVHCKSALVLLGE